MTVVQDNDNEQLQAVEEPVEMVGCEDPCVTRDSLGDVAVAKCRGVNVVLKRLPECELVVAQKMARLVPASAGDQADLPALAPLVYTVEDLDTGVVQTCAGDPGGPPVKEFTSPSCRGSYLPVDWDSPLTPSDHTNLPLVLVTSKPTPHFSGHMFRGARFLRME